MIINNALCPSVCGASRLTLSAQAHQGPAALRWPVECVGEGLGGGPVFPSSVFLMKNVRAAKGFERDFNLKLNLDCCIVSGRNSQMWRFFCSCAIPAVFGGLGGLVVCQLSPKCHSCSEAGCFLSASTPDILESVSA